MLPLENPDRIHIAFDDHRLVANAGLLLPATLALRLGLGEVVDRYLDLGTGGPYPTGWRAPPTWPRLNTRHSRVRPAPRRCGLSFAG